MKKNTLKKIITVTLISTILIGSTLPIRTVTYAKTVVQKPITNVVKNIKYSFKGYQNGVPIYTSTVKSENSQCTKTQDSIKQMINNLDNFGLYYVALTEVNKVKDVSARKAYKAVIDKYRKQSATPYIADILNKLNVLKKAPNLLDYSNLLNDVKTSQLKQSKDLKYNVTYVQNEINAWVNSGKLYTKQELDAIKLIRIAQGIGTVKNIDNAKKAVSLVKNTKSAKWLSGEVNKIQLINQVKSLPFSGATCPIVHTEFSKYDSITVNGNFINLLNQSALYLTGDAPNRFPEVRDAWEGKIVGGKYKVTRVMLYSTNCWIQDFTNISDFMSTAYICRDNVNSKFHYDVYNAQQTNRFAYTICRLVVELEAI